MRWNPKLESILTLVRIHRESMKNIDKFYSFYNWLSCHPHQGGDFKRLKYFQEGIALNKRRAFIVEQEIRRREFNKVHSFSKLGF